ncbi:hypothetical protein [Frankia sp. ACN1ag]|uniref:hypothetical protein n=1 Tax=Frankia sp. ACN1ag TaxID=102891 RepID=UPI0006DCA7D9|nr:hypothetical protein [Frankia sp. ACN1ag]KQC35035.1 hypothetical protein UK82_28650 [Frankia sp. ACN1ag]
MTIRDASDPIPPAEYVRVVQDRDALRQRVDELEALLCRAKDAALGVAVAALDADKAGRRRQATIVTTAEDFRRIAWEVAQDRALAIAVYFATDRHPPTCQCSLGAIHDQEGWDEAYASIADYWPSHVPPVGGADT